MNTPVSGNFKPYIEGLIEQKRSIGYPYDISARRLKAFSVFCMNHYPDETTLTKAMAMQWAEKRQNENVNSLLRRITPIRQLAKYMNRLGIEAYIIPPGIPGKLSRYVPHIFTDQELQAFFAEIDRCPVIPYSPARHFVIPVFFRVLYCCGLRSSEARLLKVEDVDLETGKLTIRQSKGNKTLAVPLMDKTIAHLHEYMKIFHPDGDLKNDQYLFYTQVKGLKGKMSDDNVSYFLKRYAGSAHQVCSEVPLRMHAHLFRHTRAMHLYQAGIPLSYIKDFLGHVSVRQRIFMLPQTHP